MLKIIKYLKKSSVAIIAIIILLVIQAMSDLSLPEYTAKIVNEGIAGNNMDIIFSSAIQMLGLALLSAIAAILVTLAGSRVAAKFGKEIRSRVFKKVVNFSNTEFDKFSTASLITRTTNDVQQIQTLMVMIFRIIIYAPIIGIGGFIKVLNTESSMSWIIGVAVIAVMAIIVVLFTVAMPKFKKVQTLTDKLNLVSREILTGLPVIRSFSNQKFEEKRFDDSNKDLQKVNLFVNRIMTFMMPTMFFIMNGISVLIIWVGSKNVDLGNIQVGDMMTFIQYAMQIIMAFLMISMTSIILPRAAVSGKRIAEILETEISIKDPDIAEKFNEKKKGFLEFKNVSFKYDNANENVLNNISFIAKPGETTAIIGSTGSGKSTLVNLIPRLFDATEGEILIDDINIKDVKLVDLREKIGFIPQKGVLFSGTIESNIKYGNNNITDEEMISAANISQAIDFINEKEDKYKEEISQGGKNVSGGQKQRLAIARAIAKKPDVYVFDDSFSALDYETDIKLRRSLKEVTHDSTVIIIAQRVSTIIEAEQIVVLNDGQVVGIGTHKELMENCEVYSEIALSQLSKEELENE